MSGNRQTYPLGSSMEYNVHLNQPGTLKDKLPENLWPDITGLKVTGVIGRKDFDDVLDEIFYSDGYFDEDDEFIFEEEQTYHLRHLDLGEATYVDGDELPYFLFHSLIESFILPKGIKSTLDKNDDVIENSVRLRKLILPDGLETLAGCSNCPNLAELRIPESVKSIHCFAFSGCESINNIFIPRNVEYVDGSSFAGCNIKAFEVAEDNPYLVAQDGIIFSKDMSELVAFPSAYEGDSYSIPTSVKTIGFGAFMDCHLKHINIPDSVVTIEDDAFSNTEIIKVVIPDSVKKIGELAFRWSDALEEITLGSGIEYLPRMLFSGCSSLKRIEIPGNVKTIEYSALAWADGLEEIIFHSGVEVMNNESILWIKRSNLKRVFIPDTMKRIDGGSFNYSSAPDVFDVDPKNPYFCVKDDALYSLDGTSLISVPNRQRKSFVVPKGTRIIEELAFYDLSNLAEIELPDTIEDIKYRAFQGCDALRTLYIPVSLKKIDIDALWADNLKDIVLSRVVPPEMYGYIKDTEWRYEGVRVYVPLQSVEVYKNAPGWKYFRIMPINLDYD